MDNGAIVDNSAARRGEFSPELWNRRRNRGRLKPLEAIFASGRWAPCLPGPRGAGVRLRGARAAAVRAGPAAARIRPSLVLPGERRYPTKSSSGLELAQGGQA